MHGADMTTILLNLALIIVLARFAGWLFTKMSLPAVVGEILAGVALGPSLFGYDFTNTVFPPEERPYLSLLANVGLMLYMFVVGLELDPSLVKGRERSAGAVSAMSIVAPFGLGLLLAVSLQDQHNSGNDFWPFALFLGAALSATAFPVLARILTDRQMQRTEVGGMALACAAVDDVLAWSLLAVVIGIAGGGSPWVTALAIPFALVAIFVVRPLLTRLVGMYERAGRLTPSVLAIVLVGLLVFSATTDHLNVHFIIGAFLFGAIMPHEGAAELRHEILVRLEQISVLLLLPVFFLVSGLNVDLRGLGPEHLLELALILVVAVGGKYVGTFIGARATGMSTWESSALGILMNTRGLTELVILNVGRELGLIGEDLFTMLVVMALVTTVMTGPLLKKAYPDKRVARDVAEAERAALGSDAAATQILVVADPAGGNDARVEVALAEAMGVRPAEVVVASFQPQAGHRLDVGTGLSDDLVDLMATMERTEALVRRGRDVGVPVKISSRLSADVSADLVSLCDALSPAAVVVADGDREVDALVAHTDATVLVVDPTTDSLTEPAVVQVTWSGGRDGEAAVLTATRLATFLDQPLRITTEGASARRAASVVAHLAARGVALTEADGAPGPRVAAAIPDIGGTGGAGTPPAAVDVRVRAEAAATPLDWSSVNLGRSAAQAQPSGAVGVVGQRPVTDAQP